MHDRMGALNRIVEVIESFVTLDDFRYLPHVFHSSIDQFAKLPSDNGDKIHAMLAHLVSLGHGTYAREAVPLLLGIAQRQWRKAVKRGERPPLTAEDVDHAIRAARVFMDDVRELDAWRDEVIRKHREWVESSPSSPVNAPPRPARAPAPPPPAAPGADFVKEPRRIKRGDVLRVHKDRAPLAPLIPRPAAPQHITINNFEKVDKLVMTDNSSSNSNNASSTISGNAVVSGNAVGQHAKATGGSITQTTTITTHAPVPQNVYIDAVTKAQAAFVNEQSQIESVNPDLSDELWKIFPRLRKVELVVEDLEKQRAQMKKVVDDLDIARFAEEVKKLPDLEMLKALLTNPVTEMIANALMGARAP